VSKSWGLLSREKGWDRFQQRIWDKSGRYHRWILFGLRECLAAAALWGVCAWFLSLDVDFLVTNLRSAPTKARSLADSRFVRFHYKTEEKANNDPEPLSD
jgi:hypothetical protein